MSTVTELREFPIAFDSAGTLLVGRVYRNDTDLSVRQPAVVVTGSWLTVKEQMAHTYALALAERGITVLTFDFAGFGQSGGDLRQAEQPGRKVADIDAAVRYLAGRSYVHADRIGYLGICASAQYAFAAAAQGTPIAALASVAGWFHDIDSVAPFYGGAEGVSARLAWADEALDAYLTTGELLTVPAYEVGNDRAGMSIPLDYYAAADRGAVPEWTNAMAQLSWRDWLTFDGLAAAGRVSVPSLFVHSDDCVFPDNVRAVSSAVDAATEEVWSEGGQIDFYDRPAQVATAVDAVESHLKATLRVAA